MESNKPRMKTNFDKLEAAGLVAGEDTTAAVKARTQSRITDLKELNGKISKVEAALADLYVLAKPQRLKKLTQVLTAVKKLHSSPLPTGTKKHIGNCLNELTSLREGVYASNSQMDKKALVLISASKAKADINTLMLASEVKMDKIMADSSHASDMDEFFKKTESVIQKFSHEAEKLNSLSDKPFVIARVPVIPVDGGVSVEKLSRLGFSSESLGGYAVLHNQIVLGISPKSLLGDKAGDIKSAKVAAAIRAEADRLRILAGKKTNTKLLFVSNALSYGTRIWFWLMTEKDLDMFARAFPGSQVKVSRWGFAFN